MCVLGNNAYRLSTDGTNISGWHWLNLVTTSPAKVTGNYDLCVENHLKIVFISGRWIIVIQPDDSKKTWMPRLYVCTCIYIYMYIYVHCIYMYTVYILKAALWAPTFWAVSFCHFSPWIYPSRKKKYGCTCHFNIASPTGKPQEQNSLHKIKLHNWKPKKTKKTENKDSRERLGGS